MFNACGLANEEWETDNLQKTYNPLSRYNHLIAEMPENFFEPYDTFIDRYREGEEVKEEYKEHISDWLHADAHLHEVYYKQFKTWLEKL